MKAARPGPSKNGTSLDHPKKPVTLSNTTDKSNTPTATLTGKSTKASKEDQSKSFSVKTIIIFVLILIAVVGIAVGVVLSMNTSESFCAQLNRGEVATDDVGQLNGCLGENCPFDPSTCSSGCPFGYEADDNNLFCPVKCLCAARGIFAADIYFSEEELPNMLERYGFVDKDLEGVSLFKSSSTFRSLSWYEPSQPGGRQKVPYSISTDVNKQVKKDIMEGIKVFSEKTCIDLVPQKTGEYAINFFNGGMCASRVGKVQRHSPNVHYQQIILSPKCTGHVPQHEIMHALGFNHEQNRPDRDDYITVHYENIPKWHHDQYTKMRESKVEDLGTLYDFKSILHYRDFSKDGNPPQMTYKGTTKKVIIYNRKMSAIDLQDINALYKCPGGSPSSENEVKGISNNGATTTGGSTNKWSTWGVGGGSPAGPTASTNKWSTWGVGGGSPAGPTASTNKWSTWGSGSGAPGGSIGSTNKWSTWGSGSGAPGGSSGSTNKGSTWGTGGYTGGSSGSRNKWSTWGTGGGSPGGSITGSSSGWSSGSSGTDKGSGWGDLTFNWSSWYAWTPCVKTCGGGFRKRYRYCISTSKKSSRCSRGKWWMGGTCPVKRECPSATVVWESWGGFGLCTKTCGGGMRMRRRSCPTLYQCKPGHVVGVQFCMTNPCTSATSSGFGQWLGWGAFDRCSRSCGGGQSLRLRKCVENGRLSFACKGDSGESKLCNTEACFAAARLDSEPLVAPSRIFNVAKWTVARLCLPIANNLWLFGDFNGDGKTDVICGPDENSLKVALSSKFGPPSGVTSDAPMRDCGKGGARAGDLNADGFDDVFCVNSIDEKLYVRLSQNGTFSDSNAFNFTHCTNDQDSLIAIDSNGDGRLDLLCHHLVEENFDLLINEYLPK